MLLRRRGQLRSTKLPSRGVRAFGALILEFYRGDEAGYIGAGTGVMRDWGLGLPT